MILCIKIFQLSNIANFEPIIFLSKYPPRPFSIRLRHDKMHAEEIFGAQTWRWLRSPGQPQFFFRRMPKFSPLSSDLLKNDNCSNDSCSCQDISNLSKMSKLFEKAIVAASILVFYLVCLTQCHPVTTKTRERKCKRKFSV